MCASNVAILPAASNTAPPPAPALLAWYGLDPRTGRIRRGVIAANAFDELGARIASGELAAVTVASEHIGFREYADFVLRTYEGTQHGTLPSPAEVADAWHARVAA